MNGVKLKEKTKQPGTACHRLIAGVFESNQYKDVRTFLLDQLSAP
jgi:hypothetical protein